MSTAPPMPSPAHRSVCSAAAVALGSALVLCTAHLRVDRAGAVVEPALEPIGELLDPGSSHIAPAVARGATATLVLALLGLLWALRRQHRADLQMAEARTLREANARLEASVQARSAELDQANDRARHAARVAGMAEVANSVLHNVGNVLNSLATSSHLLGERLSHPILGDLPDLARLLTEHEAGIGHFLATDPRGREVIPFVRLLAERWSEEQRLLREEASAVEDMVRHVQEIIGSQQSLSGVTGVVARARVGALLKEALAMQGARIKERGIVIERQGESMGDVLVDRVKTVQILVNLIRNAIDALEGCEPGHRHIRLLTGHASRPGIFCIHVEDDGAGIAPDDFPHIFEYGYTTKAGGHGFGLHSSALAAQEMGGRLSAHSEGPGRGARITLELPCTRTSNAA